MKILTLFILIFIFANINLNSLESDENIELKKYHSTSRDLSNGYVRVFSFKNKMEQKKFYRLVSDISADRFIEINYNENFDKTSEIVYKKEKLGFVEEMKTIYNKKNDSLEIELLSPKFFTYCINDSSINNEHLLKFSSMRKKVISVSKYIGQAMKYYNRDSINCIVYQIERKSILFDNNNKLLNSKISSINVFYAEGIGFLGSEGTFGKDSISLNLLDIIDVKEFDNLIKNSVR